MIQSVIQAQPAKPMPVFSPTQLLIELLGKVINRRKAYEAYPSPNQNQKILDCARIEYAIRNLQADPGLRTKVAGVLKLEHSLLQICPFGQGRAVKFKGYVEETMRACRNYLGWEKAS
ncbi:MAG: hypothetical protein INR69_22275 [Mucilaginibacter polytrichastri]|nr:hypothetical protein [Mucilaginibacter polytrichastri]